MDQKDSTNKLPLWINRLLALGAILALASVTAAALHGREHWRLHREGMIADITVDLGGRPVREHCTTCHPGGRRSGVHEEEHPIREHPGIYPHSMEKLGCTGCHLGEGMALDDRVSHGLPGLGASKILKGEELQASCFKCHELEPLKGAEKAWQGYEMFEALPCSLCHRVNPFGEGGYYGPDLSAIGSYLGLDRIYEAIREPKKAPENSIMPRFPLSREQARHMSYFLKSRVEDPFYTTPMLMQAGKFPSPEMIAAGLEDDLLSGEELLRDKKCLGCHKYKEADGQIGPDHTYTGDMRTAQYLLRFIENPMSLIPGAIMPVVRMDVQEKNRLVRFLEKEAKGPVDYQDPRMLYMTLCQRCHAAAGDGFGIIEPNLANFPRAFAGNKEYFRRLEDERIVESMDKGIQGTSMPPYGKLLSRPEREGLIDLVFSAFIGIGRSDKAELAPLPEKPAVALSIERGDSLFRKKCSRCHGVAGTGHGPEELKYLPKPRNLTNRSYFAGISDEHIIRAIADGVPGTAMPPFRQELKAGEIQALVDKVKRFWAAPDQPSDPAAEACDGLSREKVG
jgi:cytochrome c2